MLRCLAILSLLIVHFARFASAADGPVMKTLESQLVKEAPTKLAADARKFGSATRGAILFHQPVVACTKCHSIGEKSSKLGPDLAVWKEKPTDLHLIEAVLQPAKKVRKGYEAFTIVTTDGKTHTGLLHADNKDAVVLRDPSRNGKLVTIAKKDVDIKKPAISIMPRGLVNQMANRQQFLDVVRYLMEISAGGAKRAKELQPPASLFALPPVPEYEKKVDHAGLIASWNKKSFERGKAIYNRLCINCHGTVTRPGNLPTSLRFASGKFKNGGDPYAMYQTLTYGFGMMVPQSWMVPQQKYDVIHYVREAYLKPHNRSQLVEVTKEYVARLPKGDTFGPKPSPYAPWENMNYGPYLIGTYEAGRDGKNIAYKGIAVRLDNGPGGVSRGKRWIAFDHDTLRVSAAWSGKKFIDYNGIMFNGRHNIHPRITGDVHWQNPTAPGWANPRTGDFKDPRFRGRDGKPYGPLPREWAHYKGLYSYGNLAIVSYTVGKTSVLEMPGQADSQSRPIFTRTFHIGPRNRDMILQVAHRNGASQLKVTDNVATFGTHTGLPLRGAKTKRTPIRFDGATYLAVEKSNKIDLTSNDYTIVARFRTKRGGTLFAKTANAPRWVPDGKALFIRGGRLTFDIGWVGAVSSRKRVADGKWHNVAMTWSKKTGRVRLYIDGKLDREGTLSPKKPARKHEVRIGFGAPNFPRPRSYFQGDIADVRLYAKQLSEKQIAGYKPTAEIDKTSLAGHWEPQGVVGTSVADGSKHKRTAKIIRGKRKASIGNSTIVAGLSGLSGAKWIDSKTGDLRLRIPAGQQTLKFTLSVASAESKADVAQLTKQLAQQKPVVDLTAFTKGGPPKWSQKIVTKVSTRSNGGPFDVDVLTRPVANPWFCRVRLTGLDFYPDGKTMAACTWDGDVWLVTGWADAKAGDSLTWRRIASGLFQPLGIRVIDKKIYLTCRDQLVILHDLNGDGEIDFYQNHNNDHQVTEHFHEFAMGLQTDDAGNFYYAKSARHALPALVAHHGTLLKISKDGSKTEILATGFRAANGVCLNPDGSFFVTDQEGHWTPKNRINWVTKGGFYGNMLGYHDVEDSSNDAMKQPLCWITNKFDRSPAELLWVKSKKWGSLNGSLLNLSYGYGKVYVVPYEKVNGQMQGGMCELPLPPSPTGLIRGRFHKNDGQLYVCGMFAWAGSQQQPGGLYRIRHTGEAAYLPKKIEAKPGRLIVTLSEAVDRKSAIKASNYYLRTWSLRRARNYGSKHYDEKTLKISKAEVSKDGKTITLHAAGLKPTWCYELRCNLDGKEGETVKRVIHGTIHALGKSK